MLINFRDEIKKALFDMEWSQNDLARASELGPVKISRLLRGGPCSVEELCAIARAIGRKPGDFLDNSSDIPADAAQIAVKLSRFTRPERFHLLQAIDSLIDLRETMLDEFKELFRRPAV